MTWLLQPLVREDINPADLKGVSDRLSSFNDFAKQRLGSVPGLRVSSLGQEGVRGVTRYDGKHFSVGGLEKVTKVRLNAFEGYFAQLSLAHIYRHG